MTITREHLLILCCILLLSGCFPVKALFLGIPDEKDPYRGKSNTFQAATTPFNFEKSSENWGQTLKVNDWTDRIPFFRSVEEVVSDRENNAFLIIRNDTILYERYRVSPTTLSTSYSIAKSFTSALIGIAIEENLIEDVEDLVANYIPEIKNTKYADQLTIKHLLNQTSGIASKLSIDPTIYYGNNILKALKKIEFAHEPGTSQHYLNVNTQMLGIILQRVTNKTVSAYLQEKIWHPLGMETDGFWATDKKNSMERTFCCMNATGRDFAKFGRLYLNDGNWNGQQIVPEKWVHDSTQRNAEHGSSHGYNYSWHIGLKEYGDYLAEGLYGQSIYVYPKKNIIIVSLNDKEKMIEMHRFNWKYIFRQIVDQL